MEEFSLQELCWTVMDFLNEQISPVFQKDHTLIERDMVDIYTIYVI